MILLAIETTDLTGSVALLEDGQLVDSRRLPDRPRSAATLAPALDGLFQSTGIAPARLGAIAVATGPGSFTGLRVGVATAKLIAYAVGAQIVGVDTLEVIAEQAPSDCPALWAVVDAQRSQLFAARYRRREDQAWVVDKSTHIVDDDALVAELSSGDAVSGPAAERLLAKLPVGVVAVEAVHWLPRAETIGALAWRRLSQGSSDDLWQLAPRYFRKSAAEEKWAAQEAKQDRTP